MDVKQANFFVHKKTGNVFAKSSCEPLAWDNRTPVVNRLGIAVFVLTSNLIPIPNIFKAHIKSDSASHGLRGTCVALSMEELNESKSTFFDTLIETNDCLWFRGENRWIPNGDIDFSTIEPVEDPRPVLPTLDELQHCCIEYDGRKTIITYYDSFVGESICNPEDEFDIEVGISIAFDRAKQAKEEWEADQVEAKKKIKVGDVVRIFDKNNIDCTLSPSSRIMKMLYKKTQNVDACLNFAHNSLPNMGKVFRVLYVDDSFAKAFIQEAGLFDNTHFVSLENLEVVHSYEEGEYVLWF